MFGPRGFLVFMKNQFFESLGFPRNHNSFQNTDSHPCTRLGWSMCTPFLKIKKYSILVLMGSVRPFLSQIFKNKSPKLRSIILLHSGLITCRSHLSKNRKLTMFMFLWIIGHDLDPQTIILDFGSRDKSQIAYRFSESENLENLKFCEFRKRRVQNNPDDPFHKLLEILNMKSRSSRKHELDIQ